ncbi:MAG TPA: peptide deformylase [Steroidobacteraceae bacterium]|jgi:peptide deformylase|nr:peptide deformylase [Steroidobacteraceae bacterium]
MALLTVLEFPDPRLRTRAVAVTVFDAGLKQLIADMFETMYRAPGIGLAATQVNVHRQLIVMDVSKDGTQPEVYINPGILEREGAEVSEEGCLSVPNVYEDVERAARIKVRAQDADGKTFERELEGMHAVCLQHEMDHLAGKLFVDYLSGLKRERIRRKLEKERRERGNNPTGQAARANARVN